MCIIRQCRPSLAGEQSMLSSESMILSLLEVMAKQKFCVVVCYIKGVTRHKGTQTRAASGHVRQVVFIYRFNNMGKIGTAPTLIYRWSLEQV